MGKRTVSFYSDKLFHSADLSAICKYDGNCTSKYCRFRHKKRNPVHESFVKRKTKAIKEIKSGKRKKKLKKKLKKKHKKLNSKMLKKSEKPNSTFPDIQDTKNIA